MRALARITLHLLLAGEHEGVRWKQLGLQLLGEGRLVVNVERQWQAAAHAGVRVRLCMCAHARSLHGGARQTDARLAARHVIATAESGESSSYNGNMVLYRYKVPTVIRYGVRHTAL